MFEGLKVWAKRLKHELVALYLAARDPRTPRLAKAIALVVVGYALSPIDLIPDFIPIIGLLDDVILVPLGILLAVRLIPGPLWQEFRATAQVTDNPRASPRWGGLIVVGIWVFCAGLALWWFMDECCF